jgi:hypothetical protein
MLKDASEVKCTALGNLNFTLQCSFPRSTNELFDPLKREEGKKKTVASYTALPWHTDEVPHPLAILDDTVGMKVPYP